MVGFGGSMITTIIYYTVKILVTLWLLTYFTTIAGLHIPFTGKGNVRDILLFSSSLFFAGLIPMVLWSELFGGVQ